MNRPSARLLGLLSLLAAGSASAQPAALPAFELERLPLDPSAAGSLVVGSGELMNEGQYRLGLTLHYERSPLTLVRDGETLGGLVNDRLTVHLTAAAAVHERIELSAQIPIIPFQQGVDFSALNVQPLGTGGVGTPVLAAKGALLRSKDGFPLDVALQVGLGLPLGTAAALGGNSGVTVLPRLAASKRVDTMLFSADLGTALRREVPVLGQPVGNQFEAGVSAVALNTPFRPELNLRGGVPLSSLPSSLEILAGGRHRIGAMETYLLAGPGIGRNPGTPLFRVLVGGAFSPEKLPPPVVARVEAPPDPCAPGQSHRPEQCPMLDDDGDGVVNVADRCPLQPEDPDKFQDDDGCPDPDNDADGIADAEDRCPNEKGEAAFNGCPPPDRDHDGVLDAVDACPDEAGPAARKGCPLHDRDNDGIVDEVDGCPDAAGPLETKGCPPQDTDNDGVFDHLDNCPKEAGPASNQGCPEKQKQLVIIRKGKLDIKDKVYFATGKATILPRSFPLLDQLARIISEHTELTRVQIEGHTDNVGPRETNLKLSQARAEAVKSYLAKKGVIAERLVAKGYGPDRPAESNATEKGRENNRRVEFVTVTVDDGTGEEEPMPLVPGAPQPKP